jgi:hypothetical protein
MSRVSRRKATGMQDGYELYMQAVEKERLVSRIAR